MMSKPAAERTPLEQQLATLAYRQVTDEYEKLDTQIKGDEKERLLALRKELASFDADKPPPLPLCQSPPTKSALRPPPTMIPQATAQPIEPGVPDGARRSRAARRSPRSLASHRPAAVSPWPTG